MTDKIKYFLEAWEMNGVGKTVATVQDSPGTVVTIEVDDLRALLSASKPAVAPEGWKLVPIEPTAEMVQAGLKEQEHETAREIWEAMLAASPAAPAQSGEPVAYANARHLAEKMASIPAFRARTEYYDVPLFTRQPAPTERALTDEKREAIGWACAASKHSGAPEVVSYHKTFEKMLGAAQPASGVDHE